MINPDQPFFVPEMSKDEEGPFREHRNVSAGPSNSKTKVIHFHLQSRGDVGKICLAVIGRTEESFGEEARMVIGLSLCQTPWPEKPRTAKERDCMPRPRRLPPFAKRTNGIDRITHL